MRPASPLKERILEAAKDLLGEGGPAGISTRAIAKKAHCSDGALYKHFESLDDVLLELFKRQLPSFRGLMELPLLVGERDVETNLAAVLETGLEFIRASMPIWISLWSDRALRKAYYERLKGQGGGPHVALERIAAYLRAEQRFGRVDKKADVEAAASLIMAASIQRGLFEKAFQAKHAASDDQAWARRTSAALARGFAPVSRKAR
jgi:AcrR family transcriptional regulator